MLKKFMMGNIKESKVWKMKWPLLAGTGGGGGGGVGGVAGGVAGKGMRMDVACLIFMETLFIGD